MVNPFQKPEAIARHLKVAVTGKSGTGKTVFGLDARNHGMGKVAVISNEAGDVHYVTHDKWGGFDRLPTQEIAQFEAAVTYLEENPGAYTTLVLDTVTGLYEALVEAKSKEDGSVSMKDWGLIKRKWKSIMARLNNLPINVVSVVHENDLVQTDSKGSSTIVGQKLDAEKTFERNPDVLLRLGVVDGKRVARVLKDRTMTYQTGDVIPEPHIGLWAKAIKAKGKEEKIAPPEEVAAKNEAAMSAPAAGAETVALAPEGIAKTLQAAVAEGFGSEIHAENWRKKHRDEVNALPRKLKAEVIAAYDAAKAKAGKGAAA